MTHKKPRFLNHPSTTKTRVVRMPANKKGRAIVNNWTSAANSRREELRDAEWLKALWFVITACCVCLCMYQIGLRVREYMNSPIRLDVSIERQTSFDFPSVTLCSGMSTRRIKHWVSVMECEKNKFECLGVTEQDIEALTKNDSYGVMTSWLLYMTKIDDISIGRPCPLFVSKSVRCRPRPAAKVMNAENLDTIWGRCLSLTLKNKTMPFKGPFTWISINWIYQSNRTGGEAFYYFVHREGDKLIHDAPFVAETIRVGYESKISISASEYYAMNTWNKPCVAKESTTQCYNDCVTKMIEAKLTCRLPFINSTKLPMCDTIRKTVTTFRIADDVYDTLEPNTCDCPRECVSIKYKLSVEREEKMNTDNTTKLILHYADDTKEMLIEKSAFAQSALFSEIGGSIGLYLGISIITIIRQFENIIRRIVHCIKRFYKD